MRLFWKNKPRNKRNASGLAPSKTQQERYKIYNSGRGSNTGPIKVSNMGKTGNGSCRASNMFMPDKNSELNRTQEIRTGSRTGRKIKVVSGNVKNEIRAKSKIVNYKNFIPNDKPLIKESGASKESDNVKVEIEKEPKNASKEAIKKVKVKVKDAKETKTSEDKRDPKILK